MGEKFNFEKLQVYQEAVSFSKKVYKITRSFPKEEMFGLTSQLRRAASSIPLNIAEGSSLTKSEFKNFLRRSRGSTYECIPIIEIALDNLYITSGQYEELYDECGRLSKQTSALMNSL